MKLFQADDKAIQDQALHAIKSWKGHTQIKILTQLLKLKRSNLPSSLKDQLHVLAAYAVESTTEWSMVDASILTDAALLKFIMGKAQIIPNFVSKVLQHPKAADMSILLLAETLVKSQMNNQHIRKLAELCLRKKPTIPTVFTWSQPEAVFPGNTQIEDFLRGNKQTLGYREPLWKGINDARKYLKRINQHPYGSSSQPKLYSFTASADGIGQRAVVTITKTKDDFNRRVAGKSAELLKELQVLMARFGGAPQGNQPGISSAAAAPVLQPRPGASNIPFILIGDDNNDSPSKKRKLDK